MSGISTLFQACVFTLSIACFPGQVNALSLLESYDAALMEDAEFQAARAAAESERESLPMARAQLLPNISANGARMKNDLTSETMTSSGRSVSSESKYDSKNYSLTLRQPIYRPYQFAGYLQAQALVEGADAVFDKAKQDLAIRVVSAYLNVLLADEALRQVEVQKSAIETQLSAAKRAVEVGHGTRTDVDDAQARMDMNRSRLLGARQQIDQARHELEILVNRPVGVLQPINRQRLELRSLEPGVLDDWMQRAEGASPELRNMKARTEAALQEVERARAGHKPTLDLIVQRSVNSSDNVTNPNSRYVNSQIGVQLAVPLFAGGYVSAQVRQALAALDEVRQLYEATRRKLATQVRKEFQGVQEGILKVEALEQAERSADQSVLSNQKGFLAGTRSRIDILNTEESRSSTRLELARERANYILSRARLLGLSGALDREVLVMISSWFSE